MPSEPIATSKWATFLVLLPPNTNIARGRFVPEAIKL